MHAPRTPHTAQPPRPALALAMGLAIGLAPNLPAYAVGEAKVSWDDIAKDDQTAKDVLSYGLGLKAQRYSPAAQISTRNVKSLVPAWSFSFGGEKQRGQEAQALVHDGVVYVTASYSRIYAVEAKTGRQLWAYEHRLPEDIRPCCDVINRGAAIYGDKVYFGTLDARVIALDKQTGKVVWNEKFGDHKVGYTMTGAPFVVKEKGGRVLVVHGSSGDEFGVVGWLFARDAETGEEVWARPLVEGHTGRLDGKDSTPTGDPKAPSWPRDKEGKPVEAWHHGGGAPWQTASYDAETNTIVIGAGNPAPWNTWKRTQDGDDPTNWDSLFTSGQAYVDATTGELKGFYQHTPNDAWDFSGNNSVVLFEYKDPKTGRQVKASAHADRNGYFFVTDREKLATGAGYPNKPTALIGAWPFVNGITWAKGFDLKTGRPIENGNRPPLPEAGADKGKAVFVSPPFLGGTNWMPMAYSPQTELFYIPANHWAMDYWTEHLTYKAGSAYLGQGFRIKRLYDDHVGILRAIDPKTGKIAWEHKERMPLWAGTLTTAGGLLVTGTSDGFLKIFDAKTGAELYRFQTGSGVVGVPITWEQDGEQYIGISSGYGGAVPLWGGDMADMTKTVTQGGSYWVFKLPKGVSHVQSLPRSRARSRTHVPGDTPPVRPQRRSAGSGHRFEPSSSLVMPFVHPILAGRPPPWTRRGAVLCAALLCLPAALRAAPPTEASAAPEVVIVNGCALWPYAQCPGADLRHANLSGKDLRGVNFRGARLHRADLRYANLAGAVLDGADLSGVKGYAVNAPGISLVNARLVGADLEMGRFFRANFSGADLTAASLEAAKMNYVWFNGATIVGANLQEAKFGAANFKGARFEGNLLRYTIFPDASFEACRGCPDDNWTTP